MLYDGEANLQASRRNRTYAMALAQGLRDHNKLSWQPIGEVIALASRLEAFEGLSVKELQANVGSIFRRRGHTDHGSAVRLTPMSGGFDEIDHERDKLNERKAAALAKRACYY
jgi:hypothetical protein